MVSSRSTILILPLLLTALLCHAGEDREARLQTLKGRYNYASADCAARILSTNRGAHYASAILQSPKDAYLQNLCQYDEKHVVIELCQDIRIDTLLLANYEYFSSGIKDFRVSVSKKFPAQQWRTVGRFEAENSKKEQVFRVADMTMYTRYVRIDFETHYGREYYCLLSSVRVYGKTMMEDFEESSNVEAPVVEQDEAKAKTPSPAPQIVTSRQTTTHTLPVLEPKFGPSQTQSTLPSSYEDWLSTDLQSLFKKELVCTPTASASSSSSAMVGGENIFKAIYDRLYVLERNLSANNQFLSQELTKLDRELKLIQGEVGIIGGHSTLNKGSIRARLLQFLVKETDRHRRELMYTIRQFQNESRRSEKLVFWISVFAALQICALVCVMYFGFGLGWFRSAPLHKMEKQRIAGHRRSLPLHKSVSPCRMVDTTLTEQQVPQTSRSASPALFDHLITTASNPLLLCESEADIIDAAYVSSPLSSCASVSSLIPNHRVCQSEVKVDDESVIAANTASTSNNDDDTHDNNTDQIEQ